MERNRAMAMRRRRAGLLLVTMASAVMAWQVISKALLVQDSSVHPLPSRNSFNSRKKNSSSALLEVKRIEFRRLPGKKKPLFIPEKKTKRKPKISIGTAQEVEVQVHYEKPLEDPPYRLDATCPSPNRVQSEAATWQQRTFKEHPASGFVQFSAYRMGSTRFAAIGLQNRTCDRHVAGRPMERPATSTRQFRYSVELNGSDSVCQWRDAVGPTIFGRLEFLYSWEHHDQEMETLTVQCILEAPTSTCGGILEGNFQGENVVLFQEWPGEVKHPQHHFFPSNITFCSPTLHTDLRREAVIEWIWYHDVITRVNKYILYDSGVWNAELAVPLARHVATGVIELTDFSGQEKYPTWFHSQMLALQDCIYRTRFSSKWIFVADFDEYLEPVPPFSLPSLLAKYEHKAWLSFGGVWWDINLCEPEKKSEKNLDRKTRFAIENLVFRADGFFCARAAPPGGRTCTRGRADWPGSVCKKLFGELCDAHFGRRKFFVNPRKVDLAGIHEVLEPRGNGVSLNARTQFRLNHFRWLASQRAVPFFCNGTEDGGHGEEGEGPWVRDLGLAEKGRRAREAKSQWEREGQDW